MYLTPFSLLGIAVTVAYCLSLRNNKLSGTT